PVGGFSSVLPESLLPAAAASSSESSFVADEPAAVSKPLVSKTARAVCVVSYKSGTTICISIFTGWDKSPSTLNFTVLVSSPSLTTSTGPLGALRDLIILALVTVNWTYLVPFSTVNVAGFEK